jgi:hypothetical protein
MKRSEMVELMALTIAKQAITSGNHNVDISWINVDALLGEMEKAGMQPPENYRVHDNGMFIIEGWEEEDSVELDKVLQNIKNKLELKI